MAEKPAEKPVEEQTETLVTKETTDGTAANGTSENAESEVVKVPSYLQLKPTGKTPYEFDIQRQIIAAFDIFDVDKTRKVDVREVGTVIRSLGCCPSEAELRDLLAEVEEEDRPGYVNLANLLPVMTNVLLENRFRPATAETLIHAFRVLDAEEKGFLTKEELTNLLTEHGEPFSQEEVDEMVTAAKDPETNNIDYYKFVQLLVVPDVIP